MIGELRLAFSVSGPVWLWLVGNGNRQRVGIFAAWGQTKTYNITDMGGVAGFKDVPQALRFSKASKSNHDGWQALFLI